MKSVKVIARHVTLTDDDDAVYEFDCIAQYPNEALTGMFTAAVVRRKGHIDINYKLPHVVAETMNADMFRRTLHLPSYTREKWFVAMLNALIDR